MTTWPKVIRTNCPLMAFLFNGRILIDQQLSILPSIPVIEQKSYNTNYNPDNLKYLGKPKINQLMMTAVLL